MNDRFNRIARAASNFVGSSGAFFFASGALVVWAISGPFLRFSDTWQRLQIPEPVF